MVISSVSCSACRKRSGQLPYISQYLQARHARRQIVPDTARERFSGVLEGNHEAGDGLLLHVLDGSVQHHRQHIQVTGQLREAADKALEEIEAAETDPMDL